MEERAKRRAVVKVVETAKPLGKIGPVGRPPQDSVKGDKTENITFSDRGTSSAYRLGKIKRDHPELAERIMAGEFKSVSEVQSPQLETLATAPRMEQLANPQNLRPPWPKGQSGNPAGHSRDRRFTAALIQQIDHNPDDCEELVKVAFDLALAGDFPMWKALFDRIDGLPKNRQPRTEDLTYWLAFTTGS
jgi:hypothetical protein